MLRYLLSLLLVAPIASAQKVKFDMMSYTAPTHFTKTVKPGVIVYTDINNTTGGFCIISMYASTSSSGNVLADFKNEWTEHAITPFQAAPDPATEVQHVAGGWKAISGAAPVKADGTDMYIILSVFSGFGKTSSILVNTNDLSYAATLDTLLAGIILDKNFKVAKTNGTKTSTGVPDPRFIGSWGKSGGSPPQYNNGVLVNLTSNGYYKGKYVFKADGSYSFQGEGHGGQVNSSEFKLVDEKGNYAVSGNQLIITPVKSIMRMVDRDGNLKKSENLSLTKRQYSYQFHFYEGINETQLILKAAKENMVDGGFSSSSQFQSSFLYAPQPNFEFRFLPLY